ncbi:hypothetical protein MMC28_005921 [Mycoblastus sanguinarius]|nr:hypothetical protein [Mycoblastus sanguinarius]
MPGDMAALFNLDANENNPPSQPQRLSRSPHPYHRHRANVLQDNVTNTAQRRNTFLTPGIASRLNTVDNGTTYFDADHRKRRKQSSSPSDSGTEADDERGSFLQGLPAPPARPRKGLKGHNGSGTASPLLTPSYLDYARPELALKAQIKRRASLQTQSCTDEETVKVREKFTRRRRAELIRRISETMLLGSIGFISCRNETQWLVRLWTKKTLYSTELISQFGLDHVPAALLGHATLVLGLYILYPLRIIYKNHAQNVSKGRSRLYIQIPAAFDPAPLLYPILVPVFVALLSLHADVRILLPNLILSIASIPSKIIPLNNNVPWHSSIQWIFSAIPVMASQKRYSENYQARSAVAGHFQHNSFDAENLLLLYPLHQTLLPTLGYLTTTSLLPAELQLLSVSMINLFVHSTSPQALILLSLLWIGGLSIFIFCGKVLTWEVALARIPGWRFKRPHRRVVEGNDILSALDDCLSGRLSRWGLISAGSEDSDSDELARRHNPNAWTNKSRKLKVDTNKRETSRSNRSAQPPVKMPMSAVGNGMQSAFPVSNCMVETPQAGSRPQRRHTLPSELGSTLGSPSKESLNRKATAGIQLIKPRPFRRLTIVQARIVEWLFALYVYVVVIAVVAVGIRTYVSRKALQGREPVGWALGYLFGDMPLFRFYTINWNLWDWIALPPDINGHVAQESRSRLDQFHQRQLGTANIRLLICIYCLGIITTGLAIVSRLSTIVEVDTRRKVFHGMMVAMFLPTIFVDPTFVSLALLLILAIFLLLDLFRASQLPPLSRPLTHFLAPYVDGRDHRGPVIVSHIFLLIGCAIPLWLSLARIQRTGEPPWEGWDVEKRDLSMVSGVVCVGMGDAAASLIGRRFGHRRWCWSGGKSLEGSLAFAVAVVLGLVLARLWLLIGDWPGDSGDAWAITMAKASVAAVGASLTEAVLTGGNDNVIVPVILWLLVRGLNM